MENFTVILVENHWETDVDPHTPFQGVLES